MSLSRIVITPAGYDDVNSVLQRLGGSLAATRQLAENEMAQLGNPTFLSGVQHLFLNCHNNINIGSAAVAVIREFVNAGGTLYASDWASSVLEAAFGHLTEFSPRDGPRGIVHASVSDLYLAKRIGASVPINFDMSGWVLIKKFPTSADIYVTDADRRPLAIGFPVSHGRVIFTSFHHHAQQLGSHTALENALLEWLIMLPTRHKLLLTTGLSLAQHRVKASKQMMGRAGTERQVMPVDPGHTQGLGVFVLSWDYDDDVEFSMRYLRNCEAAEAQKRSSNPPLVLTVRNPDRKDGVEISRHLKLGSSASDDELQSFVFASGMRRDLLGDSDWFASAVARHVRVFLQEDMRTISERLTSDHLQSIVRSILSGLGYRTEFRHVENGDESWTEIRAWSPDGTVETPDIQAEAVVHPDRALTRRGNHAALEEAPASLGFYPIHGEIIPGAERLLILLTFSRGDTEQSLTDRSLRAAQSSSKDITWRAMSSESLVLDRESETISAQEFLEDYRAIIRVYRAEN